MQPKFAHAKTGKKKEEREKEMEMEVKAAGVEVHLLKCGRERKIEEGVCVEF